MMPSSSSATRHQPNGNGNDEGSGTLGKKINHMKCPLYGCKRVFTDTPSYHIHIKDHEIPTQSLPGKKFICTSAGCSTSHPSMKSLMEHMREHHKPSIYFLCESCRAKLRSLRGLLTHLHTCSKVRNKEKQLPEPMDTQPLQLPEPMDIQPSPEAKASTAPTTTVTTTVADASSPDRSADSPAEQKSSPPPPQQQQQQGIAPPSGNPASRQIQTAARPSGNPAPRQIQPAARQIQPAARQNQPAARKIQPVARPAGNPAPRQIQPGPRLLAPAGGGGHAAVPPPSVSSPAPPLSGFAANPNRGLFAVNQNRSFEAQFLATLQPQPPQARLLPQTVACAPPTSLLQAIKAPPRVYNNKNAAIRPKPQAPPPQAAATAAPAVTPAPQSASAVWKKNQDVLTYNNRRVLWVNTKGSYRCVQCDHSTPLRKEMTAHIKTHKNAPAGRKAKDTTVPGEKQSSPATSESPTYAQL